MKKLFFILGTVALLTSCGSKKELVYYVNGECYPTTDNIQDMYNLSEKTGKEYVWFTPNCEWMTRSERDSLLDVLQEQVWKENSEKYPKEDTTKSN